MEPTNEIEPTDDEAFQERRRVLVLVAQTMAHAANEVLLLARLEETFDPKPANITGTDAQRRALRDQVGRVVSVLGGPPRVIVTAPDRPLETFDAYPAAAIDEAVLMFERARSAVCRSHLHFIAGSMIEKEPELLTGWPADDHISTIMRLAVDEFWEYAESSYVKLASLWDRLGQMLDFAFFNIRQYERDGFAAVMDRIAANYVPLSTELRESAHWKAVRAYQSSEQSDGLKWLVHRRNLIIHSLHLRPVPEAGAAEDPLFEAAYNHLEQSMRSRLATGSREQELHRMHRHLDQAAALFTEVLSLCEFAPRRT